MAVSGHPGGRYDAGPTADHAQPALAPRALRSRAMERRLRLQPGAWVVVEGKRVRISQVVDLETVLVQDNETGEARHCKVRDLRPEGATLATLAQAEAVELVEITEQEWQRAHERFEIIRPLLDD